MERQESTGVATERLPAAGHSLLNGTARGGCRAYRSLPLRYELTRRSMTDE